MLNENSPRNKQPTAVVDVDHSWKSKKLNPEKFRNTYSNIFVPFIPDQKQERLRKLYAEETKGRQYNIVSNVDRMLG